MPCGIRRMMLLYYQYNHNPMNIFFAGSIRGGRSHQPAYRLLVDELKKQGTLFNEHVADDALSWYGETDLEKEDIHDRELSLLALCDIVVAEVSTPSLGVGYLIAQAVHLGKPIVCLYQGEDTFKLSAMVKGNKHVQIRTYQDLNELPSIVQEIVPQH